MANEDTYRLGKQRHTMTSTAQSSTAVAQQLEPKRIPGAPHMERDYIILVGDCRSGRAHQNIA